ncbi:MAG: UMP kinase [Bacteroidetes bacterium]|nr:MAG: UMP kinase [Bacteroidota bacterium]
MKYKRILLKLSGESLIGEDNYGLDTQRLIDFATQIKEINEMGVQVAIVIGGGNIFRGLKGADKGFDRVKGDYMGMLATVINGLALQSTLESINQPTKVFTSIKMEPVAEAYSKPKALEALNNNEVIIFSGGTGNPYFTTDTASSLRAIEIEADALLKGTRVDGVYSADPEKDKNAVKYDEISFDEVYSKGLKVMDLTSFTMCKENNMPVLVFNMNIIGNLKKIILGENIGTLVKN